MIRAVGGGVTALELATLSGIPTPVQNFGANLSVWHNVQNLDMMYQDYVGTPAVIGTSVALNLDSAQGERRTELGPELIVNGGFDADTDWTKSATAPATVVISGGKVTLYSPAGEATSVRQDVLTANRLYKVTGTATVRSGTVKIDMGSAQNITTSGSFTYYMWATSAAFYLSRAGACDADFDNVSVREVITVTEQARGSEFRTDIIPATLGSGATASTYNSSTGEGTANRINSSNFTYVRTNTISVGRPYWIDIENTGSASLNVRDGSTVIVTLTAGTRRTVFCPAMVTNMQIIPATDGTSIAFTVHSLKECLGTPRYQTTSAQRPILGRHPKGGRRNLLLATASLSTQSVTVRAVAHTLAFTGTGTVTLSGASTAGPLAGAGANDRVTLTFTPTAGSLTLTVSGSVTIAQLEEGSAATNYQAVTTTYDCTEAGVPDCYYLQADGSDDGMVTPTLDLSATDKIGVFTAVRKLSDAARGIPVEFGTGTTNGFTINAPAAASATFRFSSAGSVQVDASTAASFAAPITSILTGLGDISGDSAILRVNGTQAASSTSDQGTGNYGNYALYFFRRGGSSLPFNGLEYGNFIVGALPDAAQIAAGEAYQNNYIEAY